jgi:DNA-binding transcriptional regulator YiaG
LTLSAITKRAHNFTVSMIRISGSQLHAARVLVGLSRENLAERAGLCRHSIRKWETSSDAVPGAMYTHLIRALDVLEAEGVRFTDGGVLLQRPAPVASTVLQSARVVA